MKHNDPKGEIGETKTPLGLIPSSAMEQTAWVHKLGAKKYGAYNWRKSGVCASTYVNAIMRHLNAWKDGETLDPESGFSHLAHIAASCNILMDADHCGTLDDDRNITPENQAIDNDFAPVESLPDEMYDFLEEGDLVCDGDEGYTDRGDYWFKTTFFTGDNYRVPQGRKYRRLKTNTMKLEDADSEQCQCGRIKVRHFLLGVICEDCEVKWKDPYP